MSRSLDGTPVLVPTIVSSPRDDVRQALADWLASYPEGTRRTYGGYIKQWFAWLASIDLHPFAVRRPDVQRYATAQTERGLADTTVAKTIGTIASFYRYAHVEGFIDQDPTVNVRRPKIDDEVSRPYLDRLELARFVAAAEKFPPRDHALAVFLAFTGLRISAALSANVETLGRERGHHTIVVLSKNRKIVTVPLVPRVIWALTTYIGERTSGPIFVGREGKRLNRAVAYRRIRRITEAAGIDKRIGCHSLRRSFITCALDAGVPLRNVQRSVHHKDSATTALYDQNRYSLDMHAGYVLSTSM